MTATTANVGAWFLGGYRHGMMGTLGESLSLAAQDNLGWALRSWKYELAYNGYRDRMILDNPVLGDAAVRQVVEFQRSHGLAADGVIGPRTGRELLQRRIATASASYGVSSRDVDGIVRHESGYDLGAIGYVDHDDRGATQKHIYAGGSVNLSQAIRPALAIPRLASQLQRVAREWDEDTAVASWNVGEGGAEWWYTAGKPDSGSPPWWTSGDLAARATAYVAAVRNP